MATPVLTLDWRDKIGNRPKRKPGGNKDLDISFSRSAIDSAQLHIYHTRDVQGWSTWSIGAWPMVIDDANLITGWYTK